MPEVVTSWDEPARAAPAAGKPEVVSDWGKEESAPSLLKRAADWVRAAAPGAVSDIERAAGHLWGLTPQAISAKGGEQAAGVFEFMTGMVPWAGHIAAAVPGMVSAADALQHGGDPEEAFNKISALGDREHGLEPGSAQRWLEDNVDPLFAPQSRTGKQIAEGFGKVVEWGQEIPGSPKSVAEAGYPGVAAVESGALQVLGIPTMLKAAASGVPLGG